MSKIIYAVVLGFVAIYVGAQLIPILWDSMWNTTTGSFHRNMTGGVQGSQHVNSTTKTFMEMYWELGGPGDSELFDPESKYSRCSG